MKAKRAAKLVNFVSPNAKAKSAVVAQLVRIARKARLGVRRFSLYLATSPQETGPAPGLRAIQDCGDVQHEILLKLLFYTAVRVSELVHIEVGDVDLDVCKIFINRGKGAKDRYILFPASFRLVLKSHLHAAPRNRYLFETRRFGPFTTRRIQQIVQGYREKAGITQPLHPHLFRHQMLTYLTSKGLSDAQIQLISGHESKKSLEVYQHLSLESVDKAYQDAVQSVGDFCGTLRTFVGLTPSSTDGTAGRSRRH
jgi:integrase/recombinase XerD